MDGLMGNLLQNYYLMATKKEERKGENVWVVFPGNNFGKFGKRKELYSF